MNFGDSSVFFQCFYKSRWIWEVLLKFMVCRPKRQSSKKSSFLQLSKKSLSSARVESEWFLRHKIFKCSSGHYRNCVLKFARSIEVVLFKKMLRSSVIWAPPECRVLFENLCVWGRPIAHPHRATLWLLLPNWFCPESQSVGCWIELWNCETNWDQGRRSWKIWRSLRRWGASSGVCTEPEGSGERSGQHDFCVLAIEWCAIGSNLGVWEMTKELIIQIKNNGQRCCKFNVI